MTSDQAQQIDGDVIRVLVADDHTMILEMIEALLTSTPGFSVATASHVAQALQLIQETGPFDLILLDVDMPGMQGIEGLSQVRSANGGGNVGLITGDPSPRIVEAAERAGAAGVVSKSIPMKRLINAIRFMASGERYFPLELIREADVSRTQVQSPLSEREFTVLQKLADGRKNSEIGESLNLAEATIKMHVKSIYRKLGVNNRTQAVIAARDLKLV